MLRGPVASESIACYTPGGTQRDTPIRYISFRLPAHSGLPISWKDLYKFRTTPLRNVELTGPFGHAGQFVDLRAFIDHYNDSAKKPMLQGTLVANQIQILSTRDTIIDPVTFPDSITDRLMSFMSALTDERARNLSSIVPDRVPSGLPVDR